MKKLIFLILTVAYLSGRLVAQEPILHHTLQIKYDPNSSEIVVKDKISIPKNLMSEKIYFYLHSGLNAMSNSLGVTIKKSDKNITRPDVGMDRDIDEAVNGVMLDKYAITFNNPKKRNNQIILEYGGKIFHPIKQTGPEYARGFSQTPGIIDKKGVYLGGSTYWVPWFNDDLFDFDLTVTNPDGWRSVSQGKRTLAKGKKNQEKWDFPHPTEEVYLIAAPFYEYSYAAGSVTAMAFLRSADENLANKYLETTAQYLEMYRQLIGPFPFSKFALVENFWETGYGMPSFTLLGEKVIRFPFILHSSYPHELLHNWWGNSVYVDFSTGNWCEGLTAYMADHLIKEQRGQGAEYRRSTLQKFTDYVNPSNDFPVNKFVNRNSASSEAIGYGKSLMMWHMLRIRFGDELFVKAFQQFNRRYKFKKASFGDIKRIFEELSGENLDTFFSQWLTRTGAPKIAISNAKSQGRDGAYSINLKLKQTADEVYDLLIPVQISTKNKVITEKIKLNDYSSEYTFTTTAKPLKIVVDPQFDVFRKLDAFETPPSLSKAFGSEKVLLVLPENGEKEKYKRIAEKWSDEQKAKFEIINESDLETLPKEKAVWFLGTDPQKYSTFIDLYGATLTSGEFELKSSTYSLKDHTVVISARHANNPSSVYVWLSVDRTDAIPGLLRKLPHYGKYSYLVFEGGDPTNIAKGQWPAINSPMVYTFDKTETLIQETKRTSLATLPPAFSAKRMMETVQFLASDKLKGRGIDGPEINQAADYIARKFKESGLEPIGDKNTFFQNFDFVAGMEKKKVNLKNVVGVIPGNKKEFNGQSVVISAHYDHLGLGWPDVYKGNEGKIHPGADDNASGVAVLLELAKTLGTSMKPDRTIIFAAFTGEEAGLVGSKYYVQNAPKGYPIEKCIADLNFDTVGRLGDKKLLIINSASANEWKFIFMGTGYVTGVESEMVMQPLDASDQVSFVNAGVPAVQFFSGPHLDYHRPTDTADKIDADGMVKVATVAKEVISYLTEREEMMTFTGSEVKMPTQGKSKPQGGGRKVSTGVMPDFAYSGSGVKIGAVSDGSPAANAGIQKGDVIISFGGVNVTNLRDYSNELKKYKPGELVMMTVLRGETEKNIEIKLKAR